jgi:hypothetical protein
MAAVTSPSRLELKRHAHAMRVGFPTAVQELRELLGSRLVAYLGSVGETRAVQQWAAGDREPSDAVRRRLRLALSIAQLIADVDGPEVTQSWFQGLNPQLDDKSPARVLRDGDIDEVGPEVLGAARTFLGL